MWGARYHTLLRLCDHVLSSIIARNGMNWTIIIGVSVVYVLLWVIYLNGLVCFEDKSCTFMTAKEAIYWCEGE